MRLDREDEVETSVDGTQEGSLPFVVRGMRGERPSPPAGGRPEERRDAATSF